MAYGFPKPSRGTALLARKLKRATRVAAEQKAMQAALKRDRRKCRWPGCRGTHHGLPLPIDPCHQVHRGLGGNPAGDRTTRQNIVALCRKHHGGWDEGVIDLQPLTNDGFDDIVAFYELDPDTGLMLHVCSEVRLGVPETRGA